MNTSLFNRAKYLFITLSAVAVVFAIPTWAQDEDEDAALVDDDDDNVLPPPDDSDDDDVEEVEI